MGHVPLLLQQLSSVPAACGISSAPLSSSSGRWDRDVNCCSAINIVSFILSAVVASLSAPAAAAAPVWFRRRRLIYHCCRAPGSPPLDINLRRRQLKLNQLLVSSSSSTVASTLATPVIVNRPAPNTSPTSEYRPS